MSWQVLCFIVLIFSVILFEANRALKLHPVTLNFWRCVFATSAFIPVLFYVEMNTSSLFLGSAFLTGIASALSAITVFHLSKQYGSKIASLHIQISTLIIFFMWLPFDWKHLIANPLHALTATLCILTGIIASYFLNQSPIMKQPLKILLSLSLFVAAITVFGKLVLEQNITMDDLIFYSFIIMTTQIIVSMSVMIIQKQSFLPTKHMIKASSVLGVLAAIGCVISWWAIAESPNPAYLNAILMTSPIVLLAYHKLFKIKDDIPLIPSFILTLSMMALAFIA